MKQIESMMSFLKKNFPAVAQKIEENDRLPDDEKASAIEKARKWDRESFARALRESRRRACGLRGKQWFNTFATFKPESASQKRGLKDARDFAENWRGRKGLMFYGPPGRGKDHLLHAITIALIESSFQPDVRYFYSLDIERKMIDEWRRDSAVRETDDSRTEEIMRECDVLIISDIHRVLHVNSAQIVNALTRTINQCEATGRPILCCSGNYDIGTYDAQLGESLGSRLAACCKWIKIESPEDYRRRE